jgi:thiol-disulfide isomerase/thioredoxin
MRKILAVILFAAIAFAVPPLPRKSPEFTIVQPGPKESLLSSYRGKVVLVGFFATYCVHCQNTAKVFNGLQEAFASEGLQVVGIAFNADADFNKVKDFSRLYAPSFPIGLSKPESVMSYLGISVMDRRWVYPQVVLIDRKGMIRAQSEFTGSPELQELPTLRPQIEKLLKER